MSLGLPLFDSSEGRRLRDRGIAIAASFPNDDWVLRARTVAEILAAKNGETTIDEVLKICPRPVTISPNATGSVFKGKQWRCVGFVQSSQAQRHAGTIRRWAICSGTVPKKQ